MLAEEKKKGLPFYVFIGIGGRTERKKVRADLHDSPSGSRQSGD